MDATKIHLPASAFGPLTFVDLRRGRTEELVVYIGGAVSDETYAQRRALAPEAILSLLEPGPGFLVITPFRSSEARSFLRFRRSPA